MSASSVREGLRLSTIFTPEINPIDPVVHRERNCTRPTKVGPGHYKTTTPDLGVAVASITKHATNAAGLNRHVSVVLTVVGVTATVDIYIADDAGAPSDDALFVECTIEALPL